MCEIDKNYCVLKCFDLDDITVNQIFSEKKSSINIKIEEQYKDFSIFIENIKETSIEFKSLLYKIKNIVGNKCYSDIGMSLEYCIVNEAIEKNIKIAVAESLTGGLVCSSIVNVSGSSAVLEEGFVTYASSAKIKRLNVKADTIKKFGPVSKQICNEMVEGLLINKNVRLGVATTGCAGPNTDEFNTPIGKVFIGVGENNNIEVREFNLNGSREYIRKAVNNTALFMLLQKIRKI